MLHVALTEGALPWRSWTLEKRKHAELDLALSSYGELFAQAWGRFRILALEPQSREMDGLAVGRMIIA